jgi:hypothetical protein
MAKTMIRDRRCPRCGAALFLSDDPMDGPGTNYCLSGHTFYSRWVEEQQPQLRRPAPVPTAA